MDTCAPSNGFMVYYQYMDTTNNKKVWWVVGIIIVIALGAWMFMRSRSVQNPTGNLQNAITVSDQAANSVSVTIDSATLAVPGFIAIHEDVNGIPGATVGTSKVLTTGTHVSESIIMTTGPGKYYWAMLHADDGNGIFDITRDSAVKNNADEIVMARFQVKSATIDLEIKG